MIGTARSISKIAIRLSHWNEMNFLLAYPPVLHNLLCDDVDSKKLLVIQEPAQNSLMQDGISSV